MRTIGSTRATGLVTAGPAVAAAPATAAAMTARPQGRDRLGLSSSAWSHPLSTVEDDAESAEPGTSWLTPASACGQHGRGRCGACHNRDVMVLLQRSNPARLAAGPIALAFGSGALAVALGPGRLTTCRRTLRPARDPHRDGGFALVLAGLVTSFSRTAERIGNLAVLAGLVWFAPLWVGWDRGPPLVRSLAMLAAGFTFPLLLHLALAYPSGQLRGAMVRAVAIAVYLEAHSPPSAGPSSRIPSSIPTAGPTASTTFSCCARSPTSRTGSRWRIALRLRPPRRWQPSAPGAAGDSGPARRALLLAVPAILLAAGTIAYMTALQRIPREDPSTRPSAPSSSWAARR